MTVRLDRDFRSKLNLLSFSRKAKPTRDGKLKRLTKLKSLGSRLSKSGRTHGVTKRCTTSALKLSYLKIFTLTAKSRKREKTF
jgi:hypothetical protein